MLLSFFYNYTSRRPHERTLEKIVEQIRSDKGLMSLTEAYRTTKKKAFKELGFQQRIIKNVRGYIVVRYTAQEMEARRIFAAHIQ